MASKPPSRSRDDTADVIIEPEGETEGLARRVPIGVSGLDELIGGGFPVRTVNVLSGPAGSAKTLFGIQFVYCGAKDHDEPGLFMALDESRENLIRATSSYSFELERLEEDGKLYIVDMAGLLASTRTAGHGRTEPNDLAGFSAIKDFLASFVVKAGIKRLVIDSLAAVSILYPTLEALREELFSLGRFLKRLDLTTLLITESINRTGDETRSGTEQFMGDSFISLGFEKREGEYRRSITVLKMRFTRHDQATHPFLITRNGIEVVPETEV